MTTITIDQDIQLQKTHFADTDELVAYLLGKVNIEELDIFDSKQSPTKIVTDFKETNKYSKEFLQNLQQSLQTICS